MHAYRSYATAVLPDIIFSLPDIPFTPPPYSQKRITKSIERSLCYLLDILKPVEINNVLYRLNVFVQMVGGIKETARSAFATTLLGELEPNEKEQTLLNNLDAGISGYVFDLVPLRQSLRAETDPTDSPTPIYRPTFTKSLPSLLKASLQSLPSDKPRIVNTTLSPHEILMLIKDIGIDVFDSFWAQQAASWGIALDFIFPAPSFRTSPSQTGKRQIGHNLYDSKFSNDFNRLSDDFLDGLSYSKQKQSSSSKEATDVCSCSACSPIWSNKPLCHSVAEMPDTHSEPELAPPYTRAYIHHLLHTHEMSAHSLLVTHNITILDAFLRNIRNFLEREPDELSLSEEIRRFEETYDSELQILDTARASWVSVDLARGKGRLAREREAAKQAENVAIQSTVDECL
ncbi:hypothetical protein Clacol_004677 [Clathrus columnatus]|uniref:tRNA-guanine(15) transglycosylase-like domain-containing protein n=1 Tax=Clathrus columnatus TaxID=1419009 RepID=A0AAV5ABP9_9AGAM|nr:hypothetical protein Clacol_004677 [Clathrus columnatus]